MYPLHTNKQLCNTVDVGRERSKTHKRVEKPTVHAKKPQSQTKQSTAVKQSAQISTTAFTATQFYVTAHCCGWRLRASLSAYRCIELHYRDKHD